MFPKINQINEKNNLYKMIFKNFETSLNIQNGGTHSTNVHNFLNSPPILIKFVSKFMVRKVLYFEAKYTVWLRSPLRHNMHLFPKLSAFITRLSGDRVLYQEVKLGYFG